jgi:hypothetical protein
VPGLVPALHRATAHAIRGKIRRCRHGRHSVSPITLNDLALVNYLHLNPIMSACKRPSPAETGG